MRHDTFAEEALRAGEAAVDELIDDDELQNRQAALTPATTPDWAKRGYAHLFNETILQADEGCDFDLLETGFGAPVGEPSIY